MTEASASPALSPDYHVGDRVLLHRSGTPETARVSAVHPHQTGTELVLLTVNPQGEQGQVVNVFAPYEGTSWVTVPDQTPLDLAGVA
jgi:hypothetical protein